jgi:hypothetical protein
MRRALAVAIVLMMALPALAGAVAQADQRQRERDRVPSARLWTEGDGVVTLNGRLSVTGSIPGRGSLQVTDHDGDARAHLAGEPLAFDRRGRARVRRASGILYVTGTRVTVRVVGEGLSFSVAGLGRARFLGEGVYGLNGGPETAWTSDWIRIRPSSSEQGRRGRSCASCSSSVVPQR